MKWLPGYRSPRELGRITGSASMATIGRKPSPSTRRGRNGALWSLAR